MKQKQRIALFGMAVVALIFAACDGDSGNNSTEMEGNSSSSTGIYSSGGQGNSSPVVNSSCSLVGTSSSSIVVSSSSAKAQSSSSVTAGVVDPSTVISGMMTDSRDGQCYKWVTVGTQTWMAENLNYAVDSSWCYTNSVDSCAKYGRLYQWASAMGLSAIYNSTSASGVISTPHQGACPAGWHIPTKAEWSTLENSVGGIATAGTALKSTSGWLHDGNGTDAYGFSALPVGYRAYSNNAEFFSGTGSYAFFWSATELGHDYAYHRHLDQSYAGIDVQVCSDENVAYSVRCLLD